MRLNVQLLETAFGGYPLAPKKIPALEVVKEIRSGMSQAEIAQKYELSENQVVSLFDKLFSADLLDLVEYNRFAWSLGRPADLEGNNGNRGSVGPAEPAAHESPSNHTIAPPLADTPKLFIDVSNQGRNHWWCYVAGIIFAFGLSSIMTVIAMAAWASDFQLDPKTARFVGMDPLSAYILANLSFVFLFLCLFLVVRFEHRRPFLTLITPNRSIDWKKLGKSFCIFSGILFAEAGVGYLLEPSDFQISFNSDRFFQFAAVAIILTPIQTTTEELFFRGYLMQMTALITRNRYALILIAGAPFGLLHLANPECADSFWCMSIYYCSVGCFLALVTLKSNGLETAMGIHAATNFFCALIISYPNSVFETDSIFRTLAGPGAGTPFTFLIMATLFYLLMFEGKGIRQWFADAFRRSGEPAVSS
jgi:uncharacterized protein